MRISTLNTTLTNQEYYTLLALANKTLHGYAVRDQIAHDSESTLVLAPGTVYAVLKRLTRARLTEATENHTLGRTAIARYYSLTPSGHRRLQAEVTRLERVIAHTHYKLGRKFS